MTLFRKFVLHETLLGAITVLVLLTPSNGQQETDPSWYDPWAKPTATAARVKSPSGHPMNPQTSFSKTSTVPKKRGRKETPRATASLQATKSAAVKP